MRLKSDQLDSLKSKSPEGVYQAVRDIVRLEIGVVDRRELAEALDDAVEAGIVDEREIRRLTLDD
ncbi:MAG: hypothetical protein QGH20_07710 [Candidatus Latescibacteria bacterium]|jgi:hypothetical protein|nr:hypothetical protein [Candidatus Latescibacterota bacterium]